VNCKYRVPYRYDDEVVIRTSIEKASSRMMRFSYELLDATETVLHADGFSGHLWLDRDSRKLVIPPASVMIPFAPRLP
jgi:acyl-CoA thioester hydrolase